MRDYISLGIAAHDKSEKSLWVVALAAFYADNYSEFARAVKRNRSTVSRWAAAYTAYKTVKPVAPCNIRELRKQLSVSHFARLYSLWVRYEFSPLDAVNYLELAADNSWSPEKMSLEIAGCEEGVDLFGDWIRFTARLREWAAHLLNGMVPVDLPDEFKEKAQFLAVENESLARAVDSFREGLL